MIRTKHKKYFDTHIKKMTGFPSFFFMMNDFNILKPG
jgi:hypothetical protein